MRQMRLFELRDDAAVKEGVRVEAIHNERGFRRIRRELARRYDVGVAEPNIEIVDVDLDGDRKLILRHSVVDDRLLDEADARRVLQHLADLWTYDVVLQEVDGAEAVRREHAAAPRESLRMAS
jgi:spore cortex formation protein SpoVR/YcgB (stage V sporulation)